MPQGQNRHLLGASNEIEDAAFVLMEIAVDQVLGDIVLENHVWNRRFAVLGEIAIAHPRPRNDEVEAGLTGDIEIFSPREAVEKSRLAHRVDARHDIKMSDPPLAGDGDEPPLVPALVNVDAGKILAVLL